jgi:hypothetical protein
VANRFEALHATGLTALVGREEELELLLRRWSRAKTGEGQVVLLSGEAGIGKSRLTAALLQTIASEPHTRMRYFCSPQHTDSAFHPILGQMERAAGFAHDDSPMYQSTVATPQLQFFVGRVEYMCQAEIAALMNTLTFYDAASGGQGHSFAKLLCTKREAFRHEAEVRILFQDIDDPPQGVNGIFVYPLDANAVFDEIVLDPPSSGCGSNGARIGIARRRVHYPDPAVRPLHGSSLRYSGAVSGLAAEGPAPAVAGLPLFLPRFARQLRQLAGCFECTGPRPWIDSAISNMLLSSPVVPDRFLL